MRLSCYVAAALCSALVVVPAYTGQASIDLRSFAGTWTEDVAQRAAAPSTLNYTFTQESDGFITIVRAGVDLRDRVRFDGADYATTGVPGRTAAWLKVSGTTYETMIKRDGVVIAKGRWILSDGGKHLKQETTPRRVDGKEITSVADYVRVSGGGDSLLGEWKPVATQSSVPDQFTLVPLDENTLRMSFSGTPSTFTIRPDRREYPITGPNSLPGMVSSTEVIDSRSLRRITLRDHQPLFETVMTLSPDGKRMTLTSRADGSTDAPTVSVYSKKD